MKLLLIYHIRVFPKSAKEPPLVLRGFERRYLEVGTSTKININLRVEDLSIWSVASSRWGS